MERRRLIWTAAISALLGIIFAPRPHTPEADVPVSTHELRRDAARVSPAAASLGALSGLPRSSSSEVDHRLEHVPTFLPEPTEAEPELEMGWISGHVVDGEGNPVGGAILHLQGPTGSEAHRIADDGEFHFAVAEGTWTVEAGFFDGEDEWRSIATQAPIRGGATATFALEILLEGAAHAVHGGLEEAFGVGWEVLHDDGPLRAGDVLTEVDGKLLADMQPEAVRAALRERPGESIRAVVLREQAGGRVAEVPVVLEAR